MFFFQIICVQYWNVILIQPSRLFSKFLLPSELIICFRKKRSTISQLIITVNNVVSTQRDKGDHEGLLLTLQHLVIRGPLLECTRSFSIPFFFLIYINLISKGLSKGTKIRLFAYDSLLYRTIETPSDSATLPKDLDIIHTWEKQWKNKFHPGKCQLLRITNKIEPIKSNYFIHNTPHFEY